MQRADSPASLRSQEAAGSRPPTAAGPKAAYRLFPSVEPTPPASPVSLQKAALSRVESQRRRSSSLDDTARTAAVNNAARLSQLTVRRGRKASVCDLKPMSTVQELPVDSPTVPARYTPKTVTSPVSEEAGHGRSSSAPTECVRDSQQSTGATHVLAWMSRQAAASTQSLHGLGLTLDEGKRPASRQGSRWKPNLRVNVGGDKEGPAPPPPPKSPRHHSRDSSAHSRTPSAHSRWSSTDGSPIAVAQSVACTAVKPIFVNFRPGSSTSFRTPPTAPETQESYFLQNTDAEVRYVMGAPKVAPRRIKKMLLRKPLPVHASQQTATPPLQLPSSKFSTGSPTSDFQAEGETTPRAMAPKPETQSSVYSETNTMYNDNSPMPTTAEARVLPPPTPRKNSFGWKEIESGPEHMAAKSGALSLSLSPPTPWKDSFHLKKGSDELATAAAQDKSADTTSRPPSATPYKSHRKASLIVTTRLEPPSRVPPPRPESPQPPTKQEPAVSVRSLMTEPSSRGVTPEPPLKPTVDRPTPELPFRSSTPDPTSRSDTLRNPLDTLKDLAKQTEALHARYASLRSDRQGMSTSIVSGLREQKAGPDYCNTLLDKHLCLAAINSSMDICFAKLKSLDCRKEEALTNVLAQRDAKHTLDKVRRSTAMHARSANSLRSTESGRSTPEPQVGAEGARPQQQRSASKLRKDSAREDETDVLAEAKRARKNSTGSESAANNNNKRNTMIRSPAPPPPPPPQSLLLQTAEPEDYYPSTDAEAEEPKKIRIKGAKAAKILGLMREAVEIHRPGSPSITLPDDMLDRTVTVTPAFVGGGGGPALLEVHIPISTSPLMRILPPPSSPAPTMPLPAPPPPRKNNTPEDSSPTLSTGTAARRSGSRSRTSASRSRSRSRAESSVDSSSPEDEEAEAEEVATPQEERAEPPPLPAVKGSERGLVQSIQVFVDDEILDSYYASARK
ncbi:hypothetical protein LTR36_010595 [Oleoguttula mirabilis]|uniref:Uncharacterized protein n=1 Tax=Oleoguttula mirabilis TaxID=1507867 RepID=A0AAV9JRM2_9PEZI|nr:hypothetical protein LTR36_010595 [Oleoguttula mirabilis]